MNGKSLAITTVLGSTMLLAATGRAALVINNSDIGAVTANHYVYSMSYTDFAPDNSPNPTTVTSGGKFFNDILSSSNVALRSTGVDTSERHFITTSGNVTTASFSYKFDFSTTDYRPTSFVISDLCYVTADPGKSTTQVSEWSADGINWTQINTRTSAPAVGGSQSTQTRSVTYNSNAIAQPNAIYYRVTWTSTAFLIPDGNQWARISDTATQPNFIADFTVAAVPEPASLGLLGVAGISMFCTRRMRNRR